MTDQIVPVQLRRLAAARATCRAAARRRRNEVETASWRNSTDFLLAVEGLTVSFDGFKAVDDLNLYIDKGELRVIIGPNGAGKTTVLDLICGKTKVTDGSIKFKNQEITGRDGARDRAAAASAASSRRRRSTKT